MDEAASKLAVLGLRALLHNYVWHPILWNLYYVNRQLYSEKPCLEGSSESKKLNLYYYYTTSLSPTTTCYCNTDMLIIRKHILYVHVRNYALWWIFPIAWASRLYCIVPTWLMELERPLKDIAFPGKFYLFNKSFCCRHQLLLTEGLRPRQRLTFTEGIIMNYNMYHVGIETFNHNSLRHKQFDCFLKLYTSWDEMKKKGSYYNVNIEDFLSFFTIQPAFYLCLLHILFCEYCNKYESRFFYFLKKEFVEKKNFKQVVVRQNEVKDLCDYDQYHCSLIVNVGRRNQNCIDSLKKFDVNPDINKDLYNINNQNCITIATPEKPVKSGVVRYEFETSLIEISKVKGTYSCKYMFRDFFNKNSIYMDEYLTRIHF